MFIEEDRFDDENDSEWFHTWLWYASGEDFDDDEGDEVQSYLDDYCTSYKKQANSPVCQYDKNGAYIPRSKRRKT